MAKGGQRRPTKRKKPVRRDNNNNNNESKTLQHTKSRRKQDRKGKTLLRQMRGMKWDEEEYSEEIEELEDME